VQDKPKDLRMYMRLNYVTDIWNEATEPGEYKVTVDLSVPKQHQQGE
jgi:hypothetical protein